MYKVAATTTAAATALALLLVLGGCSGSNAAGLAGGGRSGSDTPIVVGTTEKLTALDPAGSVDRGSLTVKSQLFAGLLRSNPVTGTAELELARSSEYTSPTEYTVTLKPGLRFANGHRLTSSDVKFSFDRQRTIADPAGPSELLSNLESVATPSADTVVFRLKVADDQVFPQVLGTSAGSIVDEQVFSARGVTPDREIVRAKAFDGQYSIDSFTAGRLITFLANPRYAGERAAATTSVALKFYRSTDNLRLDVAQGAIDATSGSLGLGDILELRENSRVHLVEGPVRELQYLVFNLDTMPYGAAQADADPRKALAVRLAVAELIDRSAIALQAYRSTVTPLYSVVPDGLRGATPVLRSLTGSGTGAPDGDKAERALASARVATPVQLTLHYSTDRFGESPGAAFTLLKSQLESSGLFAVKLQLSPRAQYDKGLTTGSYALYLGEHVARFPDASDYVMPFSGVASLLIPKYSNPIVSDEIAQQASEPDADTRLRLVRDIQVRIAADLPVVPLVQSSPLTVTGRDISGASFDGASTLRFGTLVKG